MRKVLFFLSICFSALALGQSQDNQLWSGFTLKQKIHSHWRLEMEQQFRTTDGLEDIRTSFVEVGARYEFTDYLSIKPQVRYTLVNNDRNRWRFTVDANASWEFGDFEPSYRLRLQQTIVVYTREPISGIRNRFGLKYNLSKIVDPYINYESFYRPEEEEFRANRYTLGLKWKLTKKVDLKIYYRTEFEFNVREPEDRRIVGVEFSIEL